MMRTKTELLDSFGEAWKSKLDEDSQMDPDVGATLLLFQIREVLVDIREMLGGEERAKKDSEIMKSMGVIPNAADTLWQHTTYNNG